MVTIEQSMKTDMTFLDFVLLLLKIAAGMLVLKTLLMIFGFPGYIPIVDEVYNAVITPIFKAGGVSIIPVPNY